MLKQNVLSEQLTPENPVNPCWTNSIESSQQTFQQVIIKLNQWYNKMGTKILDLRNENVEIRVKFSGKHLN
mgnify:CR=1 FL=1